VSTAEAILAMYRGEVVRDATMTLWLYNKEQRRFAQHDPILHPDEGWWFSKNPKELNYDKEPWEVVKDGSPEVPTR
jgi:hypothetical protein